MDRRPVTKIISRDRIAEMFARARELGIRTVFTNGCFDLLHVGHVRLLTRAREQGDVLIVALNSDASMRKLKGPTRPITALADRLEIIAALECVDYVFAFDDQTPVALVAALKPDVHVKGGDYNPDDQGSMPEAQIVRGYGGSVVIVDRVDGRATSSMIRGVQNGADAS